MPVSKACAFILAILLCNHIWSVAQPRPYQFAHIDVDQGLSHNHVTAIMKDREGFLWVGTNSGLNRYDGYAFRVFRNDLRDSTSISNNYINSLFMDPGGRIWVNSINSITSTNIYHPATESFTQNTQTYLAEYNIPFGAITNIVEDSRGYYWFLHGTNGLFRYDAGKKETQPVRYVSDDSVAQSNVQVTALAEEPSGAIWFIQRDGTICKLNPETLAVEYRNRYIQHSVNQPFDYRLLVDSDGDVWVFAANSNLGIFYFNTADDAVLPINEQSKGLRLNNNIVRGIVQDSHGIVWVGTDHGGVNLIDKKNHEVRFAMNNPEDSRSLGQNSINTMYKDDTGIIWIGTFKQGLSYYHENIVRFPLYRHETDQALGLKFDDVNRFVEDEKGNLWLGTNGGGLIYYDRKQQTFTQYKHDPADPNTLSNDVIVSLCYDHNHDLWIGTYYGGLNKFDGKKFTRYRHNPDDDTSLADDNVWEIFEDSSHNLWIGTLYSGVDRFDRESGVFHHYTAGAPKSIHANYISEITEDSQGNLWIGTGWGIDVLEKGSDEFKQYVYNGSNPGILSNNSILDIVEDSRGLVWVGTQDGLNLFDRQSSSSTVFRVEDGLPHNTILTVVEDDRHNLWVSTPNGISNIIITEDASKARSYSFKNYDEADGLQGKQFNENAAFKTSRGELIFGGGNGFNMFSPQNIGSNKTAPQVVLTDFQIFNKHVGIGELVNGEEILQKAIVQTREVTLRHHENVFSIEFAALSFFHPDKNVYQYKLEGFNDDWVTTVGPARKVTYTNLDPGDYVFRVKASNNDGVWNEEGTSLIITVLPPFWKTTYAMALYALVILAALLLSRRLIQQRERMKFQIEQERQTAQRMHELDMMKIRFFTNVSHEFRTPLTLILTPLEKMIKQVTSPDEKSHLQLIYRNARRLLNLVNQLLDFRKLEVQELRYNPSEGDIISFIQEVTSSFFDLSEKKNIALTFKTEVAHLEALFDQDKVEKILFNLLSNAFKFTPENGSVTVAVRLLPADESGIPWVEFSVADTGIGIPVDKQERIFDRFFQHDLPGSLVNQGSGIGLAITKEFVRIHGGNITVDSEPEQGSTFTVLLPVQEIKGYTYQQPVLADVRPATEILLDEEAIPHKKYAVLLVEDNEDFRFYLKDNLKTQYRILEARDGKAGWDKALTDVPDLIVSDVMMPEMNGLDLCKKIKNDPRTSHIPVILLTARTADEQKLEGFEGGANDYISKPFNFEILQARIRNCIAQQDRLRKAMNRKVLEVQPSEIAITSLDEKLIQRAIETVEKSMGDSGFSVEELSRELGMSRVHLYKKLLSLTGKSPIEFIRTIRLKRAAQLLEKSQLTVAEIAYEVGFNNPKYFSKYFKEEFNTLPSLYASMKRGAS